MAWANSHKTIFVYKSHEYSPELIGKCPRTAIITCHRCLEDEAASIWDAGWVQRMDVDNMASFLLVCLERYQQWRTHGPLDIDYTLFRSHPEQLYRIIASYLAYALQISVDHHAHHSLLKNEANPLIPHIMSNTSAFDATRLRQIVDQHSHPGMWCRTPLRSTPGT